MRAILQLSRYHAPFDSKLKAREKMKCSPVYESLFDPSRSPTHLEKVANKALRGMVLNLKLEYRALQNLKRKNGKRTPKYGGRIVFLSVIDRQIDISYSWHHSARIMFREIRKDYEDRLFRLLLLQVIELHQLVTSQRKTTT